MNLNDNYIFTLSFPEAKSIVASGDIHGDFIQLVFKLCVQYQMKDTILIVAGDCGFGFEKKESYENMVKQNVKRMNEANNWIVFIRGNHDNPAYFDGYTFKYKRFIAIPDYTILQARSHTVLCVGGGISIDRQYRLQAWEKKQVRSVSESSTDKLARNVYWSTEAPVFDKEKMVTISAKYTVDAAITHTAPSFC
ncbi:metallophosphoesterase [Bacteroides cellulosilyticus]|jgi:UDP-2,3-diacylglucosamine pyrophosphatase LpxH|uniref:metallophosphoesterase n=1 Tax=Bacteroides cellulosilyticus TaxID=246787 RepID=UPI0026C00FDA|nr:metallophosphoesterase [Bacteroides cellulosilyticus]